MQWSAVLCQEMNMYKEQTLCRGRDETGENHCILGQQGVKMIKMGQGVKIAQGVKMIKMTEGSAAEL